MKRKGLILLFFTIQVQLSFSQNFSIDTRADSLLDVVTTTTQSNKDKIDAYILLADIYRETDVNKAIDFSQKAYNLSLQNNSNELIANSLIELGWCYTSNRQFDETKKLIEEINKIVEGSENHSLLGDFYKLKDYLYSLIGDHDKGIDYSFMALKEYTISNDTNGLSEVYFYIGLNYYYTSNYKSALESYLISLNLLEHTKNNELKKDITRRIGDIYSILEENDTALDYYFLALNLNAKFNDEAGIVLSMNNIGSIYIKQKKFDAALNYLNRALNINNNFSNIANEALLRFNIGKLYMNQQKYDSALVYLTQSLKLYQKEDKEENIAETNLLIGKCCLIIDKPIEAINYFNVTNEWAKKQSNLQMQKSAMENLADAYFSIANYRESGKSLFLANKLSDSILKKERKDVLRNSELQIKLKEKNIRYQLEIDQYIVDKKNNEAHWQTQKITFIIIIILFIAVLVIILWSFILSYRINKQLIKKNNEIEEQKTLIEISNNEIKEHYLFTETLLNTIPNPVFYTDKNLRIIGCNNAFEVIAGQKADQLIGLHASNISKHTQLQCDFEYFYGQSPENNYKHEGTMIFADGHQHDVIYYNSKISGGDNESIGRLSIIVDVTDIKRIEHTLKESKEQLRQALNAKDKFFNIVAHDLRNPFNGILGLSGLISGNFDNYTSDEIRQYISMINTSSNQVYNLLDNLLEWARAQSGSIEKMATIFLVSDPVNECLMLLGHSFNAKNINVSLNIEEEYSVIADKNMILSVIRNIVGNAIKYTPNGGNISIKIHGDTNKVYVSVADSGIGIPDQNIAKLFRIDQPVTTPGLQNEKGTGLGLIISQEFIRQNGGELTVESTVNEGSVFTFSLNRA